MLIFLLYILIVVLMLKLDLSKGSFFTPSFFLFLPTSIIVVFCVIFRNQLSYQVINSAFYEILMYGFISFWLGGRLCFILFRNTNQKLWNYSLQIINKKKTINLLIICITLGLVVTLFIDLRQALLVGGVNDETSFATKGIIGHLNNISYVFIMFFVYLLFTNASRKIRSISIFVISYFVAVKFFTGVRGNLLLMIISIYFYGLLSFRIKLSIRQITYFILLGASCFLVPTLILGISENIEFDYIIQYFFFYLCSGVMGGSSYLNLGYLPIGENQSYLLAVPINLYKVLTGNSDYINIINDQFVQVTNSISDYTFTSNVYTMMGDIYINCGLIYYIVFFFVFGIFSYYLFLNRFRSVISMLLYSYIASVLFMAFFGQYILFIAFYEIIVAFLFLDFIYRLNYK